MRLSDILYDTSLPRAAREEISRLLTSYVAILTIWRAEERGARVPPWLAFGLAEASAGYPERILVHLKGKGFIGLIGPLIATFAEWAKDEPRRAALSVQGCGHNG